LVRSVFSELGQRKEPPETVVSIVWEGEESAGLWQSSKLVTERAAAGGERVLRCA
jgi:heme-degrading monooxygenase HmoA